MDKLRALQYFVAAARENSFSGAARRLEVSIPAVSKMIGSLERSLGASLFDRNSQGLALTAEGARYLESCQPLLEQLADADEAIGAAAARPHGEVVVGTPAFVSQHCFGPALPRFHARFPDIRLEFRIVNRVADPDAAAVDVFVLFGWHETPELIQRSIARTNYRVLASPAYWSAHGMPQRPRDLERHQCFVFRNPHGTLLDLWEFDRGDEAESVMVSGWLAGNHRDVILDAALAGEGVVRVNHLTTDAQERLGLLVPALKDWKARHAPPVTIVFRAKHRRTPRVRAFVEFATDVFRKLEAERGEVPVTHPTERPEYMGKRYGRASSVARGAR